MTGASNLSRSGSPKADQLRCDDGSLGGHGTGDSNYHRGHEPTRGNTDNCCFAWAVKCWGRNTTFRSPRTYNWQGFRRT